MKEGKAQERGSRGESALTEGRKDFMLGKGTWELLGRIYGTIRVGRIEQVHLPSVTKFRECRQQRVIGWDMD